MDKELYTFTTDFDLITNIFQIEADNHTAALKKWINEILTKSHFQAISKRYLTKRIENIDYWEIGENVWLFEIEFEGEIIRVHFVLTSQKVEPFYDTNVAPRFIHDRLDDVDKKQIAIVDIAYILNVSLNFSNESGAIESLKFGDRFYYHYLEDEDEIEKIKYIQINALKTGKNYSTDLIDQVLDLEYEYMESIGLFEEGQKVKCFGIEFKKPSEN